MIPQANGLIIVLDWMQINKIKFIVGFSGLDPATHFLSYQFGSSNAKLVGMHINWRIVLTYW